MNSALYEPLFSNLYRLRTFLELQNRAGLFVTEVNFVPLVKEFLGQSQFQRYRRDIILDSSLGKLEASRVPIRLRHVGFLNQSRAMHLFRHLAESSSLPTNVYADFFLFAEQYNAVLPGTLSSIVVAGVAVTIVSLLFIPEPLAAFWVSFSIVSINLGVLGFMSVWGIRLDFISMVTIVMSIGFCVDFAAHLAYNFAKGENLGPEQRLRNAMFAVGTPILQSASSTILGVSFMASTETYIFRSFLKTIVLVIVLGVFHGLVVLPVLLTTFFCGEDRSEEDGIVEISHPRHSTKHNFQGPSTDSFRISDFSGFLFNRATSRCFESPQMTSILREQERNSGSQHIRLSHAQAPPPLPPRSNLLLMRRM